MGEDTPGYTDTRVLLGRIFRANCTGDGEFVAVAVGVEHDKRGGVGDAWLNVYGPNVLEDFWTSDTRTSVAVQIMRAMERSREAVDGNG